MIAEKSWHLPVVGALSRIMGCIPVVRPQDSVAKGVGQVKMASDVAENGNAEAVAENGKPKKKTYTLIGEGTSFTKQLTPGDQVRFQGKSVIESGSPVKIAQVVSDTELLIEAPLKDGADTVVLQPSPFGILKRVDQSVTFAKVYTHLKRGNCIGIFPEGGSHDRTDLLPLKAGVAIMALGVKDKYNINAHVVPVGLNYFRRNRFRGRVTVEFGTPITVDDQLMEQYSQDKRGACNTFLHRVEESMRSVIVTAPDYNTLQLILTARRLFQRSGVRLSAKETQDLNRRFAEGFKVLSTVPEATKDLDELQAKLDAYAKLLRLMGLQDHQVPYIAWWTIHDVLGSALYGLLIFLLASIPTFILNAPVGLMARYVSHNEQKRALAGSKVKVAAQDVVLSKKIQFSMVAVPGLWIMYFFVAVAFTDWYWSSIVLLFASFPLFSFFGVRSVEAGMIELKTIRPLFYRLLPEYKAKQDKLPLMRSQLQLEVRQFVKKYAAQLGKLAEPTKLDWNEYMHTRALHEAEVKKLKAEADAADVKSSTPTGDAAAADESDTSAPSSTSVSTSSSASSLPPPPPEDDHGGITERSDDPESPEPRITKFHDISIFMKSEKSVADLATMERSMSCPPGYDEVAEKQRQYST